MPLSVEKCSPTIIDSIMLSVPKSPEATILILSQIRVPNIMLDLSSYIVIKNYCTILLKLHNIISNLGYGSLEENVGTSQLCRAAQSLFQGQGNYLDVLIIFCLSSMMCAFHEG